MIGGTKRMCEEFVLSNGLRVVAEPIENYPSVSVGLWIGAGSMYESAEENGLSHFVEHILFNQICIFFFPFTCVSGTIINW